MSSGSWATLTGGGVAEVEAGVGVDVADGVVDLLSSHSSLTGTVATGTRTAAADGSPLSITSTPGAGSTVTRKGADLPEDGTSVLMPDETPEPRKSSALKMEFLKKKTGLCHCEALCSAAWIAVGR